MKIFRGVYLTLLSALLGTIFGDTIWLNTLEMLDICPLQDTSCGIIVFWHLLFVCLFIVVISEVVNCLIILCKKNRMLLLEKFRHDSMVASIKVFNNSDEIIDNCFAKVNKVYLLIDGACQRIIDENIDDKRIRWDDGCVEVKIYKKSSDVLDIVRAYSENLELLFHSFPNLSLFVYGYKENGENERRAKYQLEIEICGTTAKDGIDIPIPPKISYWEVNYHSKGQGFAPKINIQKIPSMSEPTKSDITRSQMPSKNSFSINMMSEK